jgi:hypothetical protein
MPPNCSDRFLITLPSTMVAVSRTLISPKAARSGHIGLGQESVAMACQRVKPFFVNILITL